MDGNNLVPYVSQWMTIQPSLFACLDDELGKLDEKQRAFVRVCSLVLSEMSFSRYRWCGTSTGSVPNLDGVCPQPRRNLDGVCPQHWCRISPNSPVPSA